MKSKIIVLIFKGNLLGFQQSVYLQLISNNYKIFSVRTIIRIILLTICVFRTNR